MAEIDSKSIARKIEQEEYFPEARAWYSILYHLPIAERSFFIVIIVLGFITAIICIRSFFLVFPIAPRMPFVVISNDIMEEQPTMVRLREDASEDRNEAILRYFLRNYVTRRESYTYNPVILERNFYNIRSESTPEVFTAYRAWYDASNPSSPFNLYGSQVVRQVNIGPIKLRGNGQEARIIFTESLAGGLSGSKTRDWVVDITYDYTPYGVQQDIKELSMTNFFGIALDVYFNPAKYLKKEAFRITPMTFMVKNYTANPQITE